MANADSIEICITDVSCYGECDGVIEINVVGPNGPYSYSWNAQPDSVGYNILDSVCSSGSISIVITDANGLLVYWDNTISVSEPPQIGLLENVTNPSCYNYNDGSIDITTLASSPTWSWNNGLATEDLDSISSGQYILTTTASGCSRTDTFELVNPDQIISTVVTDTLSCIGVCDGQAIVVVSSGFLPYTYLWDDSNLQTNDTAFNLCFGTTSVIITDANGCMDTNAVSIQNPDTLKLSSILIDSSCFGICDGEIEVSITGGTSPYNTSWSVAGSVFDTLSTIVNNLCPDVYELTYTDANNCISTENIVLLERDSFNLQASVINDSCYNNCTGQITANLLNRNSPPFIYNWNDGQQDSIAINLCSDSISLELIDARGCRDTFFYFINQPLPLSFDSISTVDNNCFGDNQGSIVISLSGGTGTISTFWTGPNNFSATINNLPNLFSGSYSLNLEDENFCIRDTIINVSQPDSLFAISSKQDASCKFYSDGSINLSIFGGTNPNYNISWDVIISDSSFVDSLSAGAYIYTVTDTNGCWVEDTVLINEPDLIQSIITITDVLCHGYNTGIIDLQTSGGTPAYQYSIDGDSTWQNSGNFPNLIAGNYSITIIDQNNCISIENHIIQEPNFPITPNINPQHILCHSDATGSIDLTVSGGTNPYTYNWSNAETTQDIINLTSGFYEVIIIDDNGCDTTVSTILLQPDPINAAPDVSHLLCFEDSTGSIDLTVGGGTAPYVYSWSNGATTQDILPPLSAGNYVVTITDVNSCSETISITVSQPANLVVSSTSANISCFGFNDGEIDITINGGTSPYNHVWNNGNTDEDIFNLTSGTYSVLVTDENNCTSSSSIFISEPDEILIAGYVTDVLCYGGNNGSINISVSGGVGSFQYSWSNGVSVPNNLFSGTYTVDVQDGNNCIVSETFFVDEPLPFSEEVNIENVSCYGLSDGDIIFSMLAGNTPPYQYAWSNNVFTATNPNLAVGTYNLTVTDDNNCTKEFSYDIIQPDELILDYTIVPASCEEKDDGAIYTTITGGVFPITYEWSNGVEEDNYLTELSPGTYFVEIQDNNGCALPIQSFEVNFNGLDNCIEIPSGFTPNGDGVHDDWAIYGLYYFSDVLVKVYNRWGQEVFSSKGYNTPWDGKYKGVDLPIAAYYYVIELTNSNKIFNGTVTIKR